MRKREENKEICLEVDDPDFGETACWRKDVKQTLYIKRRIP